MDLSDEIKRLCAKGVAGRVFPGGVVGYIREGRTEVMPYGRLRYGADEPAVKADTVYDVASVTKSVVTGSVSLKLVEQGRLDLDDQVIRYVPELQNEYREAILVRHLLTYTVVFDLEDGLAVIAKLAPEQVFEKLCATPLLAAPGEKYLYTNAPAIILGILIERLTGEPLDALAQRYFFEPLGMGRSTMHPEKFPRRDFAPTEIDWRGEVRGIVHDEPAWALGQSGQIAGDAGLFSTAEDLLKFSQMLLDEGSLGSARVLSAETVALMHTNQIGYQDKTTGMGWDLNWPLTMGNQVSDQAFGKTGFTGCSMIIDPRKQAALVHLSNRLYPHRPPTRDAINDFRRNLADLVFGGL